MGISVMGFHNTFYSNLFWERKKNDVAFIDFKVLYNSVIVTERKSVCDLSDYYVKMNKIYWA